MGDHAQCCLSSQANGDSAPPVITRATDLGLRWRPQQEFETTKAYRQLREYNFLWFLDDSEQTHPYWRGSDLDDEVDDDEDGDDEEEDEDEDENEQDEDVEMAGPRCLDLLPACPVVAPLGRSATQSSVFGPRWSSWRQMGATRRWRALRACSRPLTSSSLRAVISQRAAFLFSVLCMKYQKENGILSLYGPLTLCALCLRLLCLFLRSWQR